MRRTALKALVATLLTVGIIGAGTLAATGYIGETRRVSTSASGNQGNGYAGGSSISGDGDSVAFESSAPNMVLGVDANWVSDIFVKRISSGETTLVSITPGNVPGNGVSTAPSISQSGTVVAFQSAANNLIAGDTNGQLDVFVRTLASSETTRASCSSAGIQGNGYSSAPSISDAGNLVVFQSDGNNLVASDTNGKTDVFLRNLGTGETRRISTNSSGLEAIGYSTAPAISGDGSKVAFESDANDLVAGDTNGMSDIFVKNLASGETTRVSRSAANVEANGSSHAPAISRDGKYVAFESDASNLVTGDTNATTDIFIKDLSNGAITRASCASNGTQADDLSMAASISGDGNYVAFHSNAINLVTGDTNGAMDVFVWNRISHQTTRVSTNSGGTQGNGTSGSPSLSRDGSFVAFDSSASNLVSGDTNSATDIFINEVDTRPSASVGAPTKPAAVYTWAPFTSTGTLTPHAGVASVTIECYRSKTGPLSRSYTAYTSSGGGIYSTKAVTLPSSGYWYLRAKHSDAIHRTSYSGWTTVYVSSAPIMTAPKVPTSMYASHTYNVYGTIKPRHTSSTYIVVNAYKLVGSTYVYKTHFHVKITNAGQAYNTTKYIASVKLTSRGYWKLRVKHTAHGVEGPAFSGYSARFKVK